ASFLTKPERIRLLAIPGTVGHFPLKSTSRSQRAILMGWSALTRDPGVRNGPGSDLNRRTLHKTTLLRNWCPQGDQVEAILRS
ncbi:MAG: hypothetical protein L6Q98_15065, partial [Anaerolineae bacterium]|nr:hypothetical protein [Anaerolineae bacterium]